MSRYISKKLREKVAERADYLCEYCLISYEDAFYGCEVEHIISRKHGGSSKLENLAYSCAFCNRFKGTDLTSIDWQTGEFIRFFNPRKDKWNEHFKLKKDKIEAISKIGETTERILQFNNKVRLIERQELIFRKRFPSEKALEKINEL
jgi:HNH endonuclease